ncbi:CPBP family intramembrane glutamic endopeptidase [Brachybacterium tyrofermentans]|uniref:Type II CAAX endopeptidase family protein n=1 Tax=Brachybacterium tyrofermentans TaxID=47848 RepID=A0ABW0FN20_9MICO
MDSTARTRPTRPGWPEILLGGLVYLAAFGIVAVALPRIGDPALAGIVGLVVSGAMGLAAFAVAALLRIRGLRAFGIRRAKLPHLLAGAGLGVAAYVVGTVLSIGFILLTGFTENVQSSYQAGAAAGALGLLLSLAAGAIITPLGEEAFFRGVLANALLGTMRPWIAIVLSASIFAVAHGLNPVLPTAFVVGLASGLLFHRTGSLWPSVVLHGFNNLTALLVPLVAAQLVQAS